MPPRRVTPVPAVAPGPAQAPGARAAAKPDQEREVEWQLAAPDLGVVRRWLGRHSILDGLAIERLSTQQLHDTYLDTPDWRIFRAGFALRLRAKQGKAEATLKGLRSARKDVADRRELTEPLPDGGIKALALASGPVGSRVRDVAGVEPLRTLFHVRTSRQRFAVRSRDPSQEVGEIALDETRFSRNGHRRATRLTRVELESAGPDHSPLEQLANRLCAECGLEPAKENKFATGLRSMALEPPQVRDPDEKTVFAPQPMNTSARAGDFAAAALRRLLLEWRAHEPGARLGERPEALHALRVTGRRMNTVLSLFRAYLPATFEKSRPKLKKLIDALGTVRDVDIRIEVVSTFLESLPEEDRGALDPLMRRLEAERSAARSGMLRALDTKAARQWLDTLPRQLDTLSKQLARTMDNEASASPRNDTALMVVPDLIRARYRKLRKCAQQLVEDSSMSEFHEVRIRAKKLRYALEVVAPTYAKPADEMLSALHKLQSRLGTQHDSDVITQYLGRLAAAPPPDFTPQTLFLIGRLAELHSRGALRVSGKIGKSLRKVRGRRWKALRLRMKELRENTPENDSGGIGIDRTATGNDELIGASAASTSSGTSGP